jgi:hypothetical protein
MTETGAWIQLGIASGIFLAFIIYMQIAYRRKR